MIASTPSMAVPVGYGRRVARIWKMGGGDFLKEWDNWKRLDPNFHCFRIRFKRFVKNEGGFFAQKQVISPPKKRSPKLRRIFRPNSEIQTVLPPKNRWSPKKRSSPKLRRIFRPNSGIQTVFLPKHRWSSKKKSLHRKWVGFFGRFQTLLPPKSRQLLHNFVTKSFRGGGLFSFFRRKSASKGLKSAILHTFQANPRLSWLRYWGTVCLIFVKKYGTRFLWMY